MSQVKRLQPLVKRPLGNSYGVTNSYAFEKALLHKTVCLCPADTQYTGNLVDRIGAALQRSFLRTVLNF